MCPLSSPGSRTLWIDPDPVPRDFNLRELDKNPVVARVLFQRGFRIPAVARAFVDPGPKPAPDPMGLPNMRAAIDRILQATATGRPIAVFGDYDVDGVTSSVLLAQALTAMTRIELVISLLPERSDGYGLNRVAIDAAHTAGAELLIAVDCGSTNGDEIRYASTLGVDTIVLDHHHVDENGPPPAIVVSPQLDPGGEYHDLTAVGVAYLLVHQLAAEGNTVATGCNLNEMSYLDLVALGTVADVASLAGINRSLVRDGIGALRKTRRVGLQALIRSSDLDPSLITANDIAFRLGPRINAAGRVRSPRIAFDLLTTEDPKAAETLANQLETLNFERRNKTEQVIADAVGLIEDVPDWESRPVLAIADPQWETGLLGLAASRLTEDYRRPVLVFREADGMLQGSARSVPGFNLIDALRQAAPVITRFGGHSMAAGLELPPSLLPDLEQILAAVAIQSGLELPLPRSLRIDADLEPVDLDPHTVRQLERLEPLGMGNPRPRLRLPEGRVMRYTTMGADNRHLKITATIANRQLEGILWSGAARSRELVSRSHVELVGRLDLNLWNGRERLQMILDDFRAS